jgi:hypothetical protein
MKALVGQLQPQRVLPVNPGTHGLRGLAIAQILHELHDADQSELPRMQGGLPLARIDDPEHLIVKQGAQLIAQPEVDIAVWEGSAGHTRGFHGNRVQAISW